MDTTSATVTTIREVGKHDGQTVTIRGWLYNLRESGKLLFPQFRDGSGMIQGVVAKSQVSPELFESIKTLTQESSVIVTGKVRADKRAPGGYETGCHGCAGGAAGESGRSVSHHAEGARRRLPDGASSPVDALAAAGGDPAGAGGDHQGGARLLRRARLHADRSADSDAGGVRRHDARYSRWTTSRSRRT